MTVGRTSVISDPDFPSAIWTGLYHLENINFIWKPRRSSASSRTSYFPSQEHKEVKEKQEKKKKKKIIQLYKTAILMPKAFGNQMNLRAPLPSNLIS